MRLSKSIYLITLLCLLGCTSTPQQAATSPSATPRKTVGLPPTWTPTASVLPSETPIRTATLTFTPFPSATPLPATLTSSPTSNIPTPTETPVTPTITPTLVTDCNFWTEEAGVFIHTAPFIDPSRLLPTMVPSTTYQAITYHPTYYEIALEGEPLGWVDYRLLAVQLEGTGCSNIPNDTRELVDFPSLCFFSADNNEVTTYSDSALTEAFDVITGTYPYVVLLQLQEAYCTSVSHAGPSFCVNRDDVRTFGACDDVPIAAIITIDDWLWSQPDGDQGIHIKSLTTGTYIALQEGPIPGPPPPEYSGEPGAWYLVQVSRQRDGVSGWVWSSIFELR